MERIQNDRKWNESEGKLEKERDRQIMLQIVWLTLIISKPSYIIILWEQRMGIVQNTLSPPLQVSEIEEEKRTREQEEK